MTPKLLETRAVRLNGRVLTARLYAVLHRPAGGRVKVTDHLGRVLFDSGDCYHRAEADRAACEWHAAQEAAAQPQEAA